MKSISHKQPHTRVKKTQKAKKTQKGQTTRVKKTQKSKRVKHQTNRVQKGGKGCNYNSECNNNACNLWVRSMNPFKKGTCVGYNK